MSVNKKYKTLSGSFLKKTIYGGGVEYYDTFAYGGLNLTPSIKGGDSILSRYSLFTIMTNNSEQIINKTYESGGKYKQFTEDSLLLNYGNEKSLQINYDKTNLDRIYTYGSMSESVRVTLQELKINWLGSLYFNTSDSDIKTYENLLYDENSNVTYFDVNLNLLNNDFNINLNTNNLNPTNIKDFISNWNKYVLFVNDGYGVEFEIIDVIIATDENGSVNEMTIGVKGNPFINDTEQTFSYHIKANKEEFHKFKNNLKGLSYILLENENENTFTSTFKVKEKNIDEETILTIKKLEWNKIDGVNPSFYGVGFNLFINKLFDISKSYDSYKTDTIYRFLIPENLLLRDGNRTEIESDDESITRLGETLRIFGAYLDEIKIYIDGISYINVVTYNQKDNTPNELLFSQANLYGWDVTQFLTEKTVTKSNDFNFWRNLIINTPYIWRSKGTRKSVEFLIEYMGIPNGLIEFNEHVYLTKNKIDYLKVKNLNDLVNNIIPEEIAIDEEGYPRPLTNNNDLYFQSFGGWYKETAGLNSLLNIKNRNNPHIGGYDGGSHYWSQFNNIIPNFNNINVSENISITKKTEFFTLNEDNDLKKINKWLIGKTTKNSFIDDINPQTIYDECGCYVQDSSKVFRIDFDESIVNSNKSITISGETFDCENVFYNKSFSKTFYKNDCENCNGLGSMVVYVVESGKYSGTTQEFVDNLALNDITLNGQNYANENGNCNPFLNNNIVKGLIKKNDCEYPEGFDDFLPKTIVFGRLYTNEVANYNNLPIGDWRLPTESDVDDLHSFTTRVDNDYTDGGKFKSTSSDYWYPSNETAENLFGFDVRGGGSFISGSFVQKKTFSRFWTSSVNNVFLFRNSGGTSTIERVVITDQLLSIRFCRDLTTYELSLDNGTQLSDYVDFEGNKYIVRKIYNRAWMCENLITKYDKNGTLIDYKDYDNIISNSYVVTDFTLFGTEIEYIVPPNTISGCTQDLANENAITFYDETKQEFANTSGTCIDSFYGNHEISKEFEKNDCGLDINGNQIKGSVETITVLENTFYGITQYEANKMADDFIERNGQNLANNQGVCLIYYNEEIVGLELTKDDCDEGYIGTTVLIDVPESIFSGYTQDFANQLAFNYAQELANENATCQYIDTDLDENTIEFGVEIPTNNRTLSFEINSETDVVIEYTNRMDGENLISGVEHLRLPLINYYYVFNRDNIGDEEVLYFKLKGDITKCIIKEFNGAENRIVEYLKINNNKLNTFSLNGNIYDKSFQYENRNTVVNLFNIDFGLKTIELENFYLGGTVGETYSTARTNNDIQSIDFSNCIKLKKLYIPNQTSISAIFNLSETLEELYCFNNYKLIDITNESYYGNPYIENKTIKERVVYLPNLKILRANATSLPFGHYMLCGFGADFNNLIEFNIGGFYPTSKFYAANQVFFSDIEALNNGTLRYLDITIEKKIYLHTESTPIITSGITNEFIDNLPIVSKTSIINHIDDEGIDTLTYTDKGWVRADENNKYLYQGVIFDNFDISTIRSYFVSNYDSLSIPSVYLVIKDGVYDINDPDTTFNDGDIIHYDPLNGWQKIN